MTSPDDAEAPRGRHLRDRAEQMWHSRHEDLTTKSPEQILGLVEELQIREIELQLQNQELRENQRELEDSRQELRDLYDFAPVAYLTIDVDGVIVRANLTLAAMFRTERHNVIGQHFDQYVDPMSQIDFHRALHSDDSSWSGELLLSKSNGTLFPVLVQMVRMGGDVVFWRCVITDISTRKAAERALRETSALSASENRYRRLAEQLIDGIFVSDAQGRFVDANQAACELVGYTLEELKALTVNDVLTSEELPRLPEQFQHLRTGQIVHNEWRFRRKDGSVFIGELVGCQLADGRLQGVVRDITQRKEAEDLQHRLHALAMLPLDGNIDDVFGAIVETAIAITHADFGDIQLVDRDSARLHIVAQRGFPQWWIDYWQNVAEGQGACGSAFEGGERIIVEDVERSPIFTGADLAMQRKAGVRAVESTPLISRSGALIGMLSTHFTRPHRSDDPTLQMLDLLAHEAADIIGEVRAQAELKRQAALLDLAHDAIFIRDRSARITYWNDGAVQCYGWSRGEALGQVSHILLQTQFPEPLDQIVETIVRVGYWEGELVHTRRDGRRITVDSRWTVQRDEIGEGFRILEINKDITDQKRLEQERMDETRKKDEFLALLGHELRNPLAAIHTAVQVLSSGDTEPRRARMETIIRAQTAMMRRLVDDLLELERITHGHIDLKLERVDLAACLQRAVAAMQSTVAPRNQELLLRLPPGSVWFMADSTRLDQIVGNLLSNASKYTPPGGRIELSGAQVGPDVIVRCTDNGQGIPLEDQQRIFEPFARGQITQLSFGEASVGLGLALVKQLTELHGGIVSVESAGAGHGSAFTVRLPLVTPPSQPAVAEEPEPASTSRSLHCIVIVEDNPSVAATLAEAMEQAGHAVRVFADGPSVLAGVSGLKPDVFLIDIGLPGMDGYELATKLTEFENTKDALRIAVSGLRRRERVRQDGDEFHHYFNKPVDVPTLLALLDQR